jgi:hypothetical protein
MSLEDPLAAARSAEDYFALLSVPFDPAVLRSARVPILRAFGAAKAAIDARGELRDRLERLRLYADALGRAHDLVRLAGTDGTAARGASCSGCGAEAGCAELSA